MSSIWDFNQRMGISGGQADTLKAKMFMLSPRNSLDPMYQLNLSGGHQFSYWDLQEIATSSARMYIRIKKVSPIWVRMYRGIHIPQEIIFVETHRVGDKLKVVSHETYGDYRTGLPVTETRKRTDVFPLPGNPKETNPQGAYYLRDNRGTFYMVDRPRESSPMRDVKTDWYSMLFNGESRVEYWGWRDTDQDGFGPDTHQIITVHPVGGFYERKKLGSRQEKYPAKEQYVPGGYTGQHDSHHLFYFKGEFGVYPLYNIPVLWRQTYFSYRAMQGVLSLLVEK